MKTSKVPHRLKVGIFAAIGLLIITILVFYIGSRQKAFGSKMKISAVFENVGGLKQGNLVRYAGVTVGSVDKIQIISDTSVKVTINLDVNASQFIKTDSKAIISTEGLLGSRYIKITPGAIGAKSIGNGDQLPTEVPVDIDEIISVFSETAKNSKNITNNLNLITKRVDDGEGTLGALIRDPSMGRNAQKMISTFENTGRNSNKLAITLIGSVENTEKNMIEALDLIKSTGENSVQASDNLKIFTNKLNNDSSVVGRFISDTSMATQVNKTLIQLENTAEDFQLTSNSVRNSWIIRLFGKNKKQNGVSN
jgi:phospholipid/cholesterol/gamma-HCH transport system substrate-binding protein